MSGMRRQFVVSLVAGAVGALLITAGPAAIAGIGGPVIIGANNTGDAKTVIQGSTSLGLVKIDNNSPGQNALALESDGPNLRISNNKRIANLNSDRVDSFHANELIRAAHVSRLEAEPVGGDNGDVLSVSITAPGPGSLIVGAALDASPVVPSDSFWCVLEWTKGAAGGQIPYTQMGITVGTNADDPSNQNCATTGAMDVTAGLYTIDLAVGGRETALLGNGSLWVLFVPFGPTGFVVSP